MVRARLPLAVALLTATLVIPATAASAAGATNPDPTVVTQQLTGQQDKSPSDTQTPAATTPSSTGSSQSGTGTSTSGGSGSAGTLDTSGGSSGLSQLTSGFSQLQDLSDQFQSQLPSGSSGSPDVAGALQTFGTCLQSASSATKPFLAGQECVENLMSTLTNDPRAKCFSQNNFTLQFLVDRLQSGQPPSQQDMTDFQNNLQGLIACLSPSSSPSESTGGGGAAAEEATPTPSATSDEAPAATPVTGNPDFTG